MVDSEYSQGGYKFFKKIRIGAKIKNPEMIRFVPDHLKNKTMYKYVVKKLPFVIDTFLISIKLKKCVIKLLYKMVEH